MQLRPPQRLGRFAGCCVSRDPDFRLIAEIYVHLHDARHRLLCQAGIPHRGKVVISDHCYELAVSSARAGLSRHSMTFYSHPNSKNVAEPKILGIHNTEVSSTQACLYTINCERILRGGELTNKLKLHVLERSSNFEIADSLLIIAPKCAHMSCQKQSYSPVNDETRTSTGS